MRTALLCLCLAAAAPAAAGPLQLVATTPDLAALARIVGGPEVEASALVKGPQDPHRLEPRPSFIRLLHDADLLLVVGMELEQGWLPTLLRSARNPAIQPGGPGYVDASEGIAPLDVPGAGASRAGGDLHRYGNPHYLTDPLRGAQVASRLAERLAAVRPEAAGGFRARAEAFSREVDTRLAQWLDSLAPYEGTLAVEDHRYWVYFADRFGIELVGTLEPYPGIAPTTRHLAEVVATIQARSVPLLLSTPYFDPRHARWVAERTQVRVVELAHQAGAREGAEGYLGTIGFNVQAVVEALASRD